jgi:signal transduction histidine kinase/DNA-binding NarL/FixJ family response regulator
MSELDQLKLLKRIDENVAGKTGDAFFRQVVAELGQALGAQATFAGQFEGEGRASMLAYWVRGEFQHCLAYELSGTPCEWVYAGEIKSYASGIRERFPVDRTWFEQLGVNSYLGVPFKGESGAVVGHLAVMDERNRDWHEADIEVLRLLSLRCAAELERGRYQARLLQSNAELAREIERREAIEAELITARVAAEAANQAKNLFISNMSHELRTPLNGIIGYAQLMQKKASELPPVMQEGLAIVERSGHHLLALINDLLDLAKIESGRFEVAQESFDIWPLLHDVAELIRLRAHAAGLVFDFVPAASIAGSLHGDARRLRQVLLNLLNNAVKFTPTGGRITFAAHLDDLAAERARLDLIVSDTGIGIGADDIDHIFDPFFRGEQTDHAVEGSGLGLAISRRIIEAMGGHVEVTSVPGAGSSFRVTLALERVAQIVPAVSATPQVRGYSGQRRRILLADDDEVNRRLLSRLLDEIGFDLELVGNGDEALATLVVNPPDLLITDVRMPRVDGIELVRRWRATEEGPRLPIIVLSARADSASAAEAFACGADAFIAKPLEFSTLLDAMARALALQWEKTATASLAAPVLHDDLTFPPTLAAELHTFAAQGDIVGLRAHAARAFATLPNAEPVRARLMALADQFDMRGIRDLLTAHLPS